MKLLTIFPSMERGGTEEYALTIASAAVKQGWEVYAAFPQTNGTVSLIQNFKEKNIHYHRLDIPDPKKIEKFKTLKYIFRLWQTLILLLKIQPNVVQINLPLFDCCFGSILACGLLKIPTVVIFHLFPTKGIFSQTKLKLYAWARARNQQWIGNSEFNRQLICESFQIPKEEVVCIYNGTNISTYSVNFNIEKITELRCQVRQELGIPQTSRIALTVARLHPQKGYKDLIPTIPYLTREFPDLKFVWVGDGEEREDLVNQVREYGVEDTILFLGYRFDVPRLLMSADIFVFPTHFEGGQSFALTEAMAQNLPIVTTNASGIPEVIQDKIHGLLCRVGDSCELLEALRWALRHPEQMQEMAVKAKLRAQEFSEEKMVKETLSVLQNLSFAANHVKSTIPKLL